MGWLGLRTAPPRALLMQSSSRAVAGYLAVSIAAAVVTSVVDSVSEYRFPHPLVSTQLHLLLSLAILIVVCLAARLLERIRGGRRVLTGAAAPPHSSSPARTLASLASLASLLPPPPIASTLWAHLTPYTITAALCSTLAALLDIRAHRTLDPSFWSFARLLPIPITAFITLVSPSRLLPSSFSSVRSAVPVLVVAATLLGGEGVSTEGGRGAWACAIGWALGVTGWVVAVQAGMEQAAGEEAETRRATDDSNEGSRSSAPPTIFLHLFLSILLLAFPTALSSELASNRRYRHYGFFTEVGFWLQETVTSLCGLANLAAFWHLITTCDTLTAFLVVGMKDFSLPRIFHSLLDNPLDSLSLGEATLSIRQQLFIFALIAVLILMSRMGMQEEEDGRGRRRE
ncbi:hypothetical protein JCM10296v2_003937 [Rhodotorula toruloides]